MEALLDTRCKGRQNGRVKNWLKALLSETAFAVWWIVSAFSTLSTFFLTGLAGKPRLVSAISTILGFAWANCRVFQKQQADLLGLQGTLAHHEERISQLRIAQDDGSRYILHPVNNVLHALLGWKLA